MASGNSSGIQYLVDSRRNSSILSPVVCFNPKSTSNGGIWQGENLIEYSFNRFIIQLLLIVIITRLVALLLRPLHQPRYLANIIGGIMVGPTCLGRIPWVARKLFPLPSVIVLENTAYLGLIYFTFITGVEIDLIAVRRTGQSVSLALACTIVPFGIGAVAAAALQSTLNSDVQANLASFVVFLGVALSVSSFSVLVRTLAELKLLNSTVGTTSLSASILVDSFVWVLLALAVTLAQNNGEPFVTLWTMMSGIGFYGAARFLVRPAANWISSRTPEGGVVNDFSAGAMLVGVMVAALIADAIGIHAVLGAFVYGFVIPSDSPVGTALIERLEDFVEGLLLPLFFGISGIKTNLGAVNDIVAAVFLILIVVASAVLKIVGCLVVSNIYQIPLRDGMAIGLLMNTKGVIELVLLNIGRGQQLLSEASFSVLVCTSAIVTAFVSPLLSVTFRSPRRLASFKRRSVQSGRPESELRIVFCVHATRHVPAMLGLLDAVNPIKRQPVSVIALHLIELSSRPSSMLIIHSTTTTTTKDGVGRNGGQPSSSAAAAATAAIARAFRSYEEQSAGVFVRTLTAVSPYPTMQQDISAIAEDFRAALIIIPFHKHRTVDGGMETTNPSLRSLNQSVLAAAPCSVAILIDRGLPAPSRHGVTRKAALFFLGGPDDREALAFASRIAGHSQFSLTVLRLINQIRSDESVLDDEYITEFRIQYVGDNSVAYTEIEAESAEDTVAALRSLVDGRHDLYIVGKECGVGSPLTAGLTDWSECPELGPIGDLLASPDFGVPVTSVLVMQQCLQMETGESEAAPGKTTMGSSRGRLAMMSAEKATYRTGSMASRTT
ncbi:cation/H(+) antiporter 15 [Dendrobium catenatum]|uniref:Cation/H(+) antiporter 15 n=1 Tax=Dendrobium catenatum TaxID=906689 RepID=A0A2I0VU09_9ASPA|nr:cation/H(+) antiporter 15 [Dendrobium catenatum]XP_028555753.1 cation/H(+) antiporter 15 [Dendrobium catenatum]PKU66908.1 Cation/H(+) antiporter 15 [Dendrobium catenatum]